MTALGSAPSAAEGRRAIADAVRDGAYDLAARIDELVVAAVSADPVMVPAVASSLRVMRSHLDAARRSLHLAAGAAESAAAIAAATAGMEEA